LGVVVTAHIEDIDVAKFDAFINPDIDSFLGSDGCSFKNS